MGTGIGILLISTDAIKVKGSNAPQWVIGALGMMFFLAGGCVFLRGLRVALRRIRLKQNATQRPREPWSMDHEWDPKGTTTRLGYSGVEHALAIAMSVGLLAPLHWIAFSASHAPTWIAAAFTFDGIFLIVLAFQVREWCLRHKYGRPYLEFEDFPARPGTILRGWLVYKRDLGEVRELTVTLRFVEDAWTNTSDAETSRRTILSHERYKDSVQLDSNQARLMSNGGLEIEFPIPIDAQPSAINRYPARYWDLEIMADVPGFNFRHYFLIPIYPP